MTSVMTPVDLEALAASCKPSGYHLLIRLPGKTNKTAAGLYVPDDSRDREYAGAIVAEVMDMGPMAYTDSAKFPSGPWCQVGDWVMFRRYAGLRFRMKDDPEHEYRLLNDDSVDAVVDPEKVESI